MANSFDPNTIVTDRLILRPLLPTDGDAIYTLRSNPQVVAMCLAHRKPETRSEFLDFLNGRMQSNNCVSHCVELRFASPYDSQKTDAKERKSTQDGHNSVQSRQGESDVIGLLGAHHVPEIGYIFLPEHWGKGFATEALKGWMRWYWDVCASGRDGREYLEAWTGPEAERSRNVLRKCGFLWEGKSKVEVERDGGEGEEGGKCIMVDVWRVMRPASQRG